MVSTAGPVTGAPERPAGPTASFVVRLWFEPSPERGSGEWRGTVTRVETEETRAFRTLAALEPSLFALLPEGEVE